MKYLFLILVNLAASLQIFAQEHACDPSKPTEKKTFAVPNSIGGYGKAITKDKAITVYEMVREMMDKKRFNTKITGTVTEVCQKKGCWMAVAIDDKTSIRMTFKDYAFFVPFDATGKTFYAEGVAYFNETSVEMLRHYAEDAKKSREEIESITEPEYELMFEAVGVLFE
jgi:hypothetical protein